MSTKSTLKFVQSRDLVIVKEKWKMTFLSTTSERVGKIDVKSSSKNWPR